MKDVSIIIPCLNEQGTIKDVIKETRRLFKNEDYEILAVDGGSTDGTLEILETEKEFEKNSKNFRIVRNIKGQANALRYGILLSQGNVIIFQDADMEFEPQYSYSLYKHMPEKYFPLSGPHAIYGSRYLQFNNKSLMIRRFGHFVLEVAVRVLYGKRITDIMTGTKIFTREAIFAAYPSEGRFGHNAEITAKLLKKGYKIEEWPIYYKFREKGRSKFNTIRDGLDNLATLFRVRFFE